MPDYDDLLRAARAATEPDADTRAALEAQVRAGARPARRAPRIAMATGALALAAAALVAVWPAPRVDRPLDHGHADLGALVQVEADGAGTVSGTPTAMALTWTSGTLSVEVEPHRGVQLAVSTPEGEVRVVGTGFTVTRDALGTAVAVRHGKVAVSCARGESRAIEAGEALTCLPTTSAGALARVLALRGTLDAKGQLAEVDDALALPGGADATRAELHALRAGALLESGAEAEALTEAEATLALPGVTRADELHRLAARLRLRHDDCAGALPHLRALAASGTLGDDAPALTACENSAGQ